MKVIAIDWSNFLFMSAFASLHLSTPATYTAMSMILGNLKRIGVDKDDLILVCCDYLGSWRKEYEVKYKGDRAEKRAKSPVDFDRIFKEFNWMLEQIEEGTNWHILKAEHLEADDWMAGICRYYKDREIILLTSDSDLEQCWEYKNVKIFSPHRKMKRYKIRPTNFNVYNIIAKKIYKETADNLTHPVLSQEDYDKRMKIVNLLELPDWVENIIKGTLSNIKPKTEYTNRLPYNTINVRYQELYNDKSKVLTYEDTLKKLERKKKRYDKKKKKTI